MAGVAHSIAAALLLIAIATLPAPAAPTHAEVVIGTTSEPDTLNLLFAQPPGIFAASSVLATVFTFDIAIDSSFRPIAQGVERIPNLKDGTWSVEGERMTLRWTLRPRRWHDGRSVTCQDYVFAHLAARDPRVSVAATDLDVTRRISGVTCPDGAEGRSILVTYGRRYASAALTVTEFGALPHHLLNDLHRRDPTRLRNAPFGNEGPATVGDGPYRIVEWRKGTMLTVEAVPNHPIFGASRIRRITWRFYPNIQALLPAALRGDVDVVSSVALGPAFDRALELERNAAGRFRLLPGVPANWEHVDFNLDDPVLQDIRIRRAIAHAINRRQITGLLFAGRVVVAHSYLPPGHPGYTTVLPTYPHDPARARALLRQAGYTPGADGIVRDAAGRRLALELNTIAESLTRVQIARLIQEQLRQVGIDVNIVNFPARVYFEILLRRRFKAMAVYAWVFGPVFDCDQLYTIDGIPNEANNWSGANYPGYRNTEMDRACRALPSEVDDAVRKQLFQETARILARDLPALPLYFGIRTAAVKTSLEGVSMGFPCLSCPLAETWAVTRWYWK
jgi:peptide/nickel transport system substrate-binding protein